MSSVNGTIRVRTQPASSKDQVVGLHDGAIKIKITAPAVDGKANQHLIKSLTKKLGVAKQDISITKGQTSRLKTITINGLNEAQIHGALLPDE